MQEEWSNITSKFQVQQDVHKYYSNSIIRLLWHILITKSNLMQPFPDKLIQMYVRSWLWSRGSSATNWPTDWLTEWLTDWLSAQHHSCRQPKCWTPSDVFCLAHQYKNDLIVLSASCLWPPSSAFIFHMPSILLNNHYLTMFVLTSFFIYFFLREFKKIIIGPDWFKSSFLIVKLAVFLQSDVRQDAHTH